MRGRAARLGRALLGAALLSLAPGPAGAEAPHASAPPDAPAFAAGEHEAPPVPPSFLSHLLSPGDPWLELRYPASLRDRVPALLAAAEHARRELSEAAGMPVLEHVEIRVARGPEEMAMLAPEGAPPPAGASATTYGALRLAVVSLGAASSGSTVDGPAAVRHALAHLALQDATAGRALPAWASEGFAVSASESGAMGRRFTLASAAARGALLRVAELDAALAAPGPRAELAAAEAGELVGALRAGDRKETFIALLERVRRGEDFEQARADLYGEPASALDATIRSRAGMRWGLLPVLAVLAALALATIGIGLRRSRRATPVTIAPAPEPRGPLARRPRRLRPLPHEADVPKVEHDGRWHTLH